MNIQEQARQLVQPISTRYDRYDARVQRLGRILSSLRRHRVLVAVLSGTLLALLLAFLFLIGSFFSDGHCQDFVYGDTPACDVQAFLAGTELQFAGPNSADPWQSVIPNALGQHRIRGVSKNGFGIPKYSNEMTFTLLPRRLELTLPTGNTVYGDLNEDHISQHTVAEGLAPGDQIAELKWDLQTVEGPAVQIRLAAVRITDTLGRDVTACYQVHAPDSLITLLPRPISIATVAESFIYKGTSQHPVRHQLSAGSLAPGDFLQVRFAESPMEAGSYDLLPVCTVFNAAGEDVTQLYRITPIAGKITILPIALSVRTGSAEKVYDATPLACPQWELTAGTVLPGHTLRIEVNLTQTSVGIRKNEPVFQVFDENGTDVTHNYSLDADCGELVVTPILLRFETDSAKKVYDGKQLIATGFRLVEGALLPGHSMYAYSSGYQIYAGSSPNKLNINIYGGKNNIQNSNYRIEVTSGTLTVEKRELTLLSDSAEKLFDGTPLTCAGYSIVGGSLAPGDSIYLTDFKGSQTNVGSSPNSFYVGICRAEAQGLDVTSSYHIKYQHGTLTVHPNPDYVPPEKEEDDDQKPNIPSGPGDSKDPVLYQPELGTGINFPDNRYDNTVFATVYAHYQPDPGQQIYFRAGSYGDYWGRGWSAPTPYQTTNFSPLEFTGRALYPAYQSQLMEIELTDQCPILFPYYSRVFYHLGDGDLNNDSYFVTEMAKGIVYGISHMEDPGYYPTIQHQLSPEDAVLEEDYRVFVYENYLDVPESTRQAILAWADSQGIQPDSPTLITDIQLAVQNAGVYDKNAEAAYSGHVDDVVHFLTEAKAGICQHFASAATLLYRCYGIPARYTVGFLVTLNDKQTQITGSNTHAWAEIYQPGLGWIPMEVTSSEIAPAEKRDLRIRAASATKYYDAAPFGAQFLQQCTLDDGQLLPGHHLELTYADFGNHTLPGTYFNVIQSCRVLDENGTDVTNLYGRITFQPGSLNILPRQITVASGSALKEYDETILTCDDFWLLQGTLAQGDSLKVETTGSIRTPGSVENKMTVTVLHTDLWGQIRDVTKYYNIHTVYGTLTILPSALDDST